MADFGIVPEGFRTKILRECLDEIEQSQLADISAELDVSPQSPDGQRNAIAARAEALIWELAGSLYEMLDPEKAEGALLVSACKLSGTVPQAATFSTVSVVVNLDALTELTAGVVWLNVSGKPTVRATPVEDLTATIAGDYTLTFRAEFAGPVAFPAGALTETSVGPAVGAINSAANALDGRLGLVADTEATLRLRRVAELAAAGSSSVPGLTTDLLQAKNAIGDPLVTYALVFENSTDTTDANGRPRKSIECLVVPSGTNAAGELAAFIWQAKGGGPSTFGTSSEAFTDETGALRTVYYSVPTDVLLYVKYTLKTNDSFAGSAAFKTTVAALLNAVQPGAAFAEIWDAQVAANQPGVTNAVVTQGLTASPVGTADIAIGVRSRAAYDSTRIEVVLV
jgi:hypothetical protein